MHQWRHYQPYWQLRRISRGRCAASLALVSDNVKCCCITIVCHLLVCRNRQSRSSRLSLTEQSERRGKRVRERKRERGGDQRHAASDLAMMLLIHPPQSVADSWRSEKNQGVNAGNSSYDGGAVDKIQETEQENSERRGRRNEGRLVTVRSCVTKSMRLSEMSMYTSDTRT